MKFTVVGKRHSGRTLSFALTSSHLNQVENGARDILNSNLSRSIRCNGTNTVEVTALDQASYAQCGVSVKTLLYRDYHKTSITQIIELSIPCRQGLDSPKDKMSVTISPLHAWPSDVTVTGNCSPTNVLVQTFDYRASVDARPM